MKLFGKEFSKGGFLQYIGLGFEPANTMISAGEQWKGRMAMCSFFNRRKLSHGQSISALREDDHG